MPSQTNLGALAEGAASLFRPSLWTRLAALITVGCAVVVLIGWRLHIPILMSAVPGAVEMKPNTAVSLIALAACLTLLDLELSAPVRRAAQALSIGAAALGVGTLLEYRLGSNFGIDELLFRDIDTVFAVMPGRMSPYTGVAFACFGIGLACLPYRRLRGVTTAAATIGCIIGIACLLGYLWKAPEITTDQVLPPVAIHTAACLLLLGIGTLATLYRHELSRGGEGTLASEIEGKLLGGFLAVFLAVVVGGGYTYQSGARFASAMNWLFHTQTVRATLQQLYASLSYAEVSRSNYLLTNNTRYRSAYAEGVAETRDGLDQLAKLIVDNPGQVATFAELKRQVDKHLQDMNYAMALYHRDGAAVARAAIGAGSEAETISIIHGLLTGMDHFEEGLLDKRRQDVERARIGTLISLLATLGVISVLFGILLSSIRRALLARQQTEADIRRLNAELESRVAARTRELSRQEEMNRLLVDNLAEGLAVCDDHGRLTFVNKICRQWYEEDVGTGAQAVPVEEWGSRYDVYEADGCTPLPTDRIPLMRALRGEQVHNTEISVVVGVRRRVLLVSGGPLYDAGGSSMGAGVLLRDVTERVRVMQELEQAGERLGEANLELDRERQRLAQRVEERTAELVAANRRLEQARVDAEQASRAKSAFLAAMSHEIRTPINGVVGMAEVLAHGTLSAQETEAVTIIRDSAYSLLGLIDDILDFSKIEAGRLDLERTPVSVAELVEAICSSLSAMAASKGVDLFAYVDPALPDQIWADLTRLRQVLNNLLGNAIKFSGSQPRKRGRVAVRAELAKGSPLRLTITIIDNGIGIAPEAMPSLFNSFTQAESSTTRRFGGSGLGLAICKRLVDLMGGEIGVSSRLGEGSVFTVRLPANAVSAARSPLSFDLAGLNCIVVASPGIDVQDVRSYLEYAGARVLTADNCAEAAAQAAGLEAPIVIQGVKREDRALDILRSSFAAVPSAAHVLISRGQRGGTLFAAPNVLSLNCALLRRKPLLQAVAVAAGRASPETVYEHSEEKQMTSNIKSATVAEARSQGRLILVVEDDEINRKLIRKQLDLLGYTAEMVNDGAEALERWRHGDYGLVLTDLHMPKMDGYMLARAIRHEESRGRIPILALTANALRGESARALEAGMDEYLTKPVQLQTLKKALDKWMPAAPENPPTVTAPEWESAPIPVDPAALQALVGDDEVVTREFFGDYLSSSRRLAAEMRAAHDRGDLGLLGAIAHKLKSSSRAVGAGRLGDLCAELEKACARGEAEFTAAKMIQFEAAYGDVEADIESRLAGPRRSAGRGAS